MERFLNLALDPSSHVPRIPVIINDMKDDLNVAFYTMGNWLHQTNELNPIYTLVSLRDLVEMSPLSKKNSNDPEKLDPKQSYKFLFLMNAIAARKVIPDDKELEQAKNDFFLGALSEFIQNVDIKVKFAPEFLSAVITTAARFIQEYSCDISNFATTNLYKAIVSILNKEVEPIKDYPLSNFANSALFAFLSPLDLSFYNKTDLFNNIKEILNAAIVRLLIRIIPKQYPENSDELKVALNPLCIKSSCVKAALLVMKELFHGDEKAMYAFKDNTQYLTLCETIVTFWQKSNSFKNSISYDSLIKLSHSLTEIQKMAEEHPCVWEDFLKDHSMVSDCLEDLLGSKYDSTIIGITAGLIKLGNISFKNAELPVRLFVESESKELREQLEQILLNTPEVTANELCKNFKNACNVGSRSSIFFNLLGKIITKVENPTKIVVGMQQSLRAEFEAIKQHPNSNLYTQLQQYIDVNASYLDDQPCSVCNNPERVSKTISLNRSNFGAKYTDKDIMYRFKTPLLISSISFSFSIRKKEKIPKVVKFYAASLDITDNNQLVNQNWRFMAEMNFDSQKTSDQIRMPIPLFATCFKISIEDFWEDQGDSLPRCPQCRSEVDPRSGVCPRCHENAYQCRNCRNINYNVTNPFICTECGNSNFAIINCTVDSVESFSHTRVNSQEDVDASIAKIDQLMETAANIFDNIQRNKERINDLLSPTKEIGIASRISELNKLYNETCKRNFLELTEIVQHVTAIKKAVVQYLGLAECCNHCADNMCYNCRQSYIKNGIQFMEKIAELSEEYTNDTSKLLIYFLESGQFTSAAVGSLVSFCKIRPELTEKVVAIFVQSLPTPSPHIVKLFIEMLKINDKYQVKRFESITNATIECVKLMDDNTVLVPTIINPLLKALLSSSIIIRSKDSFDMRNAFMSWSKREDTMIDPLSVLPRDIAKKLIICPNIETRKLIEQLLKDASSLSHKHMENVLVLITDILQDVTSITRSYGQAFSVLSFILTQPREHVHAINSEIFTQIIKLINNETARLIENESDISLDLTVGYGIDILTALVENLIGSGADLRFMMTKKKDVILSIIRDYFGLKSLIIQRSKFIDLASKRLEKMILIIMSPEITICEEEEEGEDKVTWTNTFGPQLVVKEAFSIMNKSPMRIINVLSALMFPVKEALNFPIIIKKIRSQEDFIPGKIPPTPIMSNDIGLLMRDVKAKICVDLDMGALLNEEHGMELLVDGNIIDLDLKLEDIYNKVWMPHNGDTPMIVIFRLQGLDGEATEPMIQSFPSDNTGEVAPEIKYAYTKVLSEGEYFVNLFNAMSNLDIKSLVNSIKLLDAMAAIKENVHAMNNCHGVSSLFNSISLMIEYSKTEVDDLESIIKLTNTLVNENPAADEQPKEHIDFIFNALSRPVIRDNEKLVAPLLSLLFPLANRSEDLMQQVLEFFMSGLKPTNASDDFNFFQDSSSYYLLNSFSEFVSVLPNNDLGNALRKTIAKEPFIKDAFEFIVKTFPPSLEIKSKEWERGTDVLTVPTALKFLSGMVLGSEEAQMALAENNGMLIKFFLKLKNVASSTNIGDYAESVLKNAETETSKCAKAIADIKDAKEQEEKERMAEERKKLLEAQTTSTDLDSLLSQLGDESEQACCICKEGYDYYPDLPLGIYAFLSKDKQYTHVATHFVWVHNQCHQNELNDRQSRMNEWQSAAIRNCETPCNSIFPIPGPDTSRKSYFDLLLNFYNRNSSCDIISNIINDIAYHISLIAKKSFISRELGGGSAEYDVKIIPYLVNAVEVIIEEKVSRSEANLRDSLEKNLQEQLTKPTKQIFGYALCLMSLEEWNASKLSILRTILKPILSGVPQEERFEKAKSTLVEFLIADIANRSLKEASGNSAVIGENGVVTIGHHKGEMWIEEFLNKVKDDGVTLMEDWQDIADDIDSEYVDVEDVRAVFIHARIEGENPDEFLASFE